MIPPPLVLIGENQWFLLSPSRVLRTNSVSSQASFCVLSFFLGLSFLHDSTADRSALSRFLLAQGNSYETALAELRRGMKRPPLDVVYLSADCRPGKQPDGATLRHQVQGRGRRVRSPPYPRRPPPSAQGEALLNVEGKSASDIMGCPDDHKLRSGATLPVERLPPGAVFLRLLDKFSKESPILTLLSPSWPGRMN